MQTTRLPTFADSKPGLPARAFGFRLEQAPIRRRATMSPTQLAIRCAQLNKDLEIARQARDLPRMQQLISQQ
jgi:hypothetical protein